MHFEFHIEDLSGEKAMEILAPKLLGENDTYRIHSYRGIGRIPPKITTPHGAKKQTMLDNLPILLKGFGKAYPSDGENYLAVIVIICDLDDNEKSDFLDTLIGILSRCDTKPETLFCFAIEELEAWYLGDLSAVKKAYPASKQEVLNRYVNDSICGTWELLADAIFKGGSAALKKLGYPREGIEKSKWATDICSFMDAAKNLSPSFNFMRTKLVEAAKRSV
jgi:hypothetical protein